MAFLARLVPPNDGHDAVTGGAVRAVAVATERPVLVRVEAGAIELTPQGGGGDDEEDAAPPTLLRISAFTCASRRSRARRGSSDCVDVRVVLEEGDEEGDEGGPPPRQSRHGVLRLRCEQGEDGARRMIEALRGGAAAAGATTREDDSHPLLEAYARHVQELEEELARRGKDLQALRRRARVAEEAAAAAAAAVAAAQQRQEEEEEAVKTPDRRDASVQVEDEQYQQQPAIIISSSSPKEDATAAAAAAATAAATAAALVAAASDEARRANASAVAAKAEADALRKALRASEARAADLRRREQQAWRVADEERAAAWRSSGRQRRALAL
jgi:hypothetical protein